MYLVPTWFRQSYRDVTCCALLHKDTGSRSYDGGMRQRVALLIVLCLLVGCANGGESSPSPLDYVAIGDSFVSGPGIAEQDRLASVCLRSDRNYPGNLAEEIEPRSFTDVSCAGASTESVLKGVVTPKGDVIEPQVDSLGRGTSLVTVGIGANDGGGAAGVFGSCLLPGHADATRCRDFVRSYLPSVYPRTRQRVVELLDTVERLAPDARLVLVGYLRVTPETSTPCPLLPTSAANLALTKEWEMSVNDMLRDAAAEADVPFVDVRPLSDGHDACAGGDSWVNGVTSAPTDGLYLHPNAAGMRAVADEVLRTIRAKED